jgi:hypothetical protein
MSRNDLAEPEEPLSAVDEPTSLEARMAARGEELDDLRIEIFEVPRWEQMLAVELRMLSWKRLRKVVEKHRRQTVDLRDLYTAADQILLATVGFYEVNDGNRTPAPNMSWTKAYQAWKRTSDVTPRQALLGLVGDVQTIVLWNDWQEWMKGSRPDVDRELQEDFPVIPQRS